MGVKGTAKVAYWDTEGSGRPPRILGEIKGTPSIRLFKPKKKSPDNRRKDVVDYNYERKAVDLKRFLDKEMPNFVEKVNGKGDFRSYEEKAERNGLPKAILFASKARTSSLTKYLSTEFRRRLLFAEVFPTKANKEIMERFGVKDLPALIVFPHSTDAGEGVGTDSAAATPIRFEGDGFTRNKLLSFLSKHALKEKFYPKKKKPLGEDEGGGGQKEKSEL